MGPLQLPDAVDHVEERGDGEADDEHQHRDCRFKVFGGAAEHDLVGS